MPSLLEILKDPNYTGANAATKRAIFDKYSALDENYANANQATKEAIRERFGVGFAPEPAGPSKERTIGESLTDIYAGLKGGVGSLLQLPSQVAGVVGGEYEAPGQETGLAATGKELQAEAEALKSPGLKAREAGRAEKVAAAEKRGQFDAFMTAFSETLRDPGLLTNFLAEQAPQLIPSLGAARLIKPIAGTAAAVRGAVGTGAAQQGADIAAGTYEQVYKELVKQGATEEEAAGRALGLARVSGAGAVAISLLAQRLPGAKAIEEAFAGQEGKLGRALGAGRGALGESISEVAEETPAKALQNYLLQQVAPETSLTAGLGETAAMAALGGAGLGGAAGLAQRQTGAEQVPPEQQPPSQFAPEPEAPPPAPPAMPGAEPPVRPRPPAPVAAAPVEPAPVEPEPVEPTRPGAPPMPEPQDEAVSAMRNYWMGRPEDFGMSFADIQNRDRTKPASIQQMTSIAREPDYNRLSVSRDFGAGAPVVISDIEIDPTRLGRIDTVSASDGTKIPVQYAVMDARDITPSNRADGTTVEQYADPAFEGIRPVAGNGRIAGLQELYRSGPYSDYVRQMMGDAAHGINPDVISAIEQPVLVRIMPKSSLTPDIADKSNVGGQLGMSPTEQAKIDMGRFDLQGIQFLADGSPSLNSLRQFVAAMPKEEQAELMNRQGQPTPLAKLRLSNALFARAYANDALIDLFAETTDPEAQQILRGMAIASPAMSNLSEAGEYDIRPYVTKAAELAVNARRQGVDLSTYIDQGDIELDPLTREVVSMFAANKNAPRRIGDSLVTLAAEANRAAEQASAPPDMFGDVAVKRPLEEVFAVLRGEPTQAAPVVEEQPEKQEYKIDKPVDQIAKEVDGMNIIEVADWLVANAPNSFAKIVAQATRARVKSMQDRGIPMTFSVLKGSRRRKNTYGSVSGSFGVNPKFDMTINGPNVPGQTDKVEGTNYRTLLHEMLHLATQGQIYLAETTKNKTLVGPMQELEALRKFLIKKVREDTAAGRPVPRKLSTRQTLANVHELISYGMTEIEVQKYLADVDFKQKNGFTRFVDAIRRLLAINKSQQSALERLVSLSEETLEVPVEDIAAGMRDIGVQYGVSTPEVADTRTPEFRKWFGDSKVVDANGEPLVVYHGTDADISKFKVSKEGGALGNGIYITPSAEFAGEYAKREGGNVMPLYASIKNPLIIDGSVTRDPMIEALVKLGVDRAKAERIVEKAYDDKGYITNEVKSRAIAQGYDGIMQYRDGALSEIVAFDSAQLKSVFNQRPTESRVITEEREAAEELGDAKLRIDNPGGEWLANNKEDNDIKGTDEYGVPKRFGPVTGYLNRTVLLPVDLLARIPGMRAEQYNVREKDLAYIKQYMAEKNKLPPPYGEPDTEHYAPYIQVDQRGRPYVNEGNHRIMAARNLGFKYLPIELRYFTGGEEVDGILSPEKLLEYDRQARAEGYDLKNYGKQPKEERVITEEREAAEVAEDLSEEEVAQILENAAADPYAKFRAQNVIKEYGKWVKAFNALPASVKNKLDAYYIADRKQKQTAEDTGAWDRGARSASTRTFSAASKALQEHFGKELNSEELGIYLNDWRSSVDELLGRESNLERTKYTVRTEEREPFADISEDRLETPSRIQDKLEEKWDRMKTGAPKDKPSSFSDVDEGLWKDISKVFFPQNKNIAQKIDGMRDRFWQRLAQGVADQYRTIKDYSPEAYMKARMSKTIDGALEGILFEGEVKLTQGALDIAKDTKGLLKVLEPVGAEVDRYQIWVALQRDAQLVAQGKAPSVSKDIVARRNELSAGKIGNKSRLEVYQQVQRDMNRLNRSVLRIALQQGIIDKEAFKVFARDINYIPFYKVMDEGGSVQAAATKSGLVNQYFSKALQGGEKPFGDLMENTLRNWSHILSASMKNEAANATVKAAMDVGGAFPNLKVGLEWRLDDDGRNGKVYSAKTGEMIGDGSLKPEYTSSDGKGLVKTMIDGKPAYFEIVDPLLLESIMSIGYLGPKSKFLDVARDFKNILQFGVTVSPAFKVRNLIRDSVQSAAVSGIGLNIAKNVTEGIAASKRGNPDYISALAGGAIFNFGSYMEGDQAAMVKRLIEQGIKGENILDTEAKLKAGLKRMWDGYQDWGNRSEAANRMALYKQLRAKGFSHLEASFQARDLLDFSMQGAWPAVRMVTQVIPFLNARVQGLYKLGRDGITPTSRVIYNSITGKPIDITDKQKAQQFSIVTGAVMLASLMLYMSFKDDDEWKKREQWDRDNFWWFKMPGMDSAIRIPKPFEIGAFGTLAERIAEQMINEGAEGKVFEQSLKRMLTDTFAINPIPQVIKPLVDLYANKDSFTGAPIETAGMERLSKAERVAVGTSPLAKALSKVANVFLPESTELSPVQADYAVKAYLGWMGATISGTSHYAVMPFSKSAYPDHNWADTMSLGFVKTLPATQSGYVTSFYENMKTISQAYADMRHYAQLGEAEKMREVFEEKGDKIMLAKMYDQASKDMAKMRQVIQAIQRDENMSGAQKKEEIDRLKMLIGDLAKMAEETRVSITKQYKAAR